MAACTGCERISRAACSSLSTAGSSSSSSLPPATATAPSGVASPRIALKYEFRLTPPAAASRAGAAATTAPTAASGALLEPAAASPAAAGSLGGIAGAGAGGAAQELYLHLTLVVLPHVLGEPRVALQRAPGEEELGAFDRELLRHDTVRSAGLQGCERVEKLLRPPPRPPTAAVWRRRCTQQPRPGGAGACCARRPPPRPPPARGGSSARCRGSVSCRRRRLSGRPAEPSSPLHALSVRAVRALGLVVWTFHLQMKRERAEVRRAPQLQLRLHLTQVKVGVKIFGERSVFSEGEPRDTHEQTAAHRTAVGASTQRMHVAML
eukprot:scaffold55546_cov69-Phaeocystis_antarctica.AAC.2